LAHSHSADGAAAPSDLTRHRRALRILIVMLIPLGIWTVAGLVMLWPGDISEHVNTDVAGYAVAGVTYPKARITEVKPSSCEGLAGSTPGVTDTRCANVTAELLEGDDQGKLVTVPLTAAVYASTLVVPGIDVPGGFTAYVVVSLMLGLVSALLGALPRILPVPQPVLVVAALSLVINGFLLTVVAWLTPGLEIDSFWAAMAGGFVVAAVTAALEILWKPIKKHL